MIPQGNGPGKEPGFSLVELLIALAVAGILLAHAAPAFVQLVHDKRVDTQINLLLADVHLARLEAIKRNLDVVMCRSIDGRHCSPSSQSLTDWSAGWILYVNSDGNKRRDPGEPLLQARAALPDTMSLHFNHWWRVSYHGDGSARNGSFTLCDSRGAAHARALILYYTGRPRISNRRPDGKALDCQP